LAHKHRVTADQDRGCAPFNEGAKRCLQLALTAGVEDIHLTPESTRPSLHILNLILRCVADAANYILALPEERRRTHWDRTVQLLLDMAEPSEISRQLELALFYDRQLNLRMRTST
jgi:hypothetical protein